MQDPFNISTLTCRECIRYEAAEGCTSCYMLRADAQRRAELISALALSWVRDGRKKDLGALATDLLGKWIRES